MSETAATTEARAFIRLYAVGPSEGIGPLNRALDDFLVGGDWQESVEWALSCEPADGWLIDLLRDMREGNTRVLEVREPAAYSFESAHPKIRSEPAERLAREGMVTVWDVEGRYVGCMGVELWRSLLTVEASRV